MQQLGNPEDRSFPDGHFWISAQPELINKLSILHRWFWLLTTSAAPMRLSKIYVLLAWNGSELQSIKCHLPSPHFSPFVQKSIPDLHFTPEPQVPVIIDVTNGPLLWDLWRYSAVCEKVSKRVQESNFNQDFLFKSCWSGWKQWLNFYIAGYWYIRLLPPTPKFLSSRNVRIVSYR